ncbi:MAG: hypothetical protein ACFFFH_17905 [Candidatus Thorarchaeota archaeon]
MIIIGNKIARQNWLISWIIITIVIFLPCFQSYSTNGWPSEDEFDILGYNIHTYFDPLPGTISSDKETITGVIDINGEFTGYNFGVVIVEYGTIYNNDTIFSNEDIGQRVITLDSSYNNYTEEILLETPTSSGQFTVYMVIYFGWREEMSPKITGNRTIILDADYQKLGYDLANIIIPGLIFLFFICVTLISFFGYKKLHQQKDIDLTEIDQRLEQINTICKPYFTRAGNLKELDITSKKILHEPGQLWRLENKKQEIGRKLEKLKPRQDEFDKIAKKLDEAREPIMNNDLFKLISSNFIQASRKRENYPSINNVESSVLELRNSLREGRWDKLKDPEKVKFAYIICESYLREINNEKLLVTNIDKEAKTLANYINRFIQIEANTRYPPDHNLILRTIEESITELEIITGLIHKLRKSDKKTLKKYKNKCGSLKKEAENNLKWLKSKELDIDTNILSRNLGKLEELINLLETELNLLS